jgi:hypothetical protein
VKCFVTYFNTEYNSRKIAQSNPRIINSFQSP